MIKTNSAATGQRTGGSSFKESDYIKTDFRGRGIDP